MTVRPQAVIVDVDGTLCDVRSIRHLVMGPDKDFDKFHRLSGACPPHEEVVEWAQDHWSEGRMVLIVTARKYKWEFLTERYCRDRLPGISFAGPFMRGDRDDRPDVEVKREIPQIPVTAIRHRCGDRRQPVDRHAVALAGHRDHRHAGVGRAGSRRVRRAGQPNRRERLTWERSGKYTLTGGTRPS